MRLPCCISSQPIETASETRPPNSSPPTRLTHQARTSALYHPWVEAETGPGGILGEGTVKPGCIFCDVNKEKGFGVVYQDEELIAFHDRNPRAKIHLLIIPRYHIESVKTLTPAHLPILDRMIALAETLLATLNPPGPTTNRPKFGFHIPPFSSVPHLHLHVLVPPYSFTGKLKYPIAGHEKEISQPAAGTNGTKRQGSVKGFSWFVEASQAREIIARGGKVSIGRS